jgi:enterochelin esterase family protein
MRKILLVPFMLFLCASIAQSQSFDAFISRVNGLPENQKQAVTDSFLLAQPHFPVVENDSVCHFIYTGTAQTVSIAGDATGWDPGVLLLQKLSGTTLWYTTVTYPSDARLDYKIVVNTSNWILDPRNPYTCLGGYGPNSELRMPLYDYPEEADPDAGIAHGQLSDTSFYSVNLANSRTILVYVPAGYSTSGKRYPVIYVHDGPDYVNLCSAATIFDNLAHAGRMAEVIGVFIPAVDRTAEYAGNKQQKFTKFMTEEIVPWIDNRYRTFPDAAHRMVLGASNGGNISLWLGMSHPEIFGLVAAQSSNVQEEIQNGFQNDPKRDLSLYIDIGRYDIDVLKPLVENLKNTLQQKGYNYKYQLNNDGHSWGNWKSHLKGALEFLMPPKTGTEDKPGGKFNINIIQDQDGRFRLIPDKSIYSGLKVGLFDLKGACKSEQTYAGTIPGGQPLWFYSDSLTDGVYFFRFSSTEFAFSRKIGLN